MPDGDPQDDDATFNGDDEDDDEGEDVEDQSQQTEKA